MLHSNTRQVVRTPAKTRTKQERHNLHADPSAASPSSAFFPPPHVLLALGTSDFVCSPHAPSLLLTHTAQNTGAGENEPTTSQVPSYDVRTRTHLAGGRRPASAATSALHSRRRRLDPPDEARDLVVNERHHHPGRPLRRANEGHQPPSCGAVFERVRRAPLPAVASCSRPQLPSGITYYLV